MSDRGIEAAAHPNLWVRFDKNYDPDETGDGEGPPEDWRFRYATKADIAAYLAEVGMQPDYEAAENAFWAHSTDLLKPTVSNTGIDRGIRIAVDAAIGDGLLIEESTDD